MLYDPGWPFKWVGSHRHLRGIALMFYFMPKPPQRPSEADAKTIPHATSIDAEVLLERSLWRSPCHSRASSRADKVPLDTNALATLAVQDHGRKKPFTTFAQEMLLALAGTQLATASTMPIGTKRHALARAGHARSLVQARGLGRPAADHDQFARAEEELGVPVDRTRNFSLQRADPQAGACKPCSTRRKRCGRPARATSCTAHAEGSRASRRAPAAISGLVNGERETIVPHPREAERRVAAHPESGHGRCRARGRPSTRPRRYYIASDDRVQAAGSAFRTWADAYAQGRHREVQRAHAAAGFRSWPRSAPQFYPSASSLQFEHTYMVLDPFRWAWIIYLLRAARPALHGHLERTARLSARRGRWCSSGSGFEVYGFVCRIIISGRPPVTDLYETVIWVSFIGMVFAVILEAVYRKRYFLYAGLPAAILTLIVADSDSTILDASINPLTAVLRNNMWLTIHVLTIVSSYAAFVLTAALGHIALVMSLWGRRYADGAGRGALLDLPRDADRHSAARHRHDPRRRLGQLFVGPLLGLGPEGDLGADHAALLPRAAARAAGRLVERLRPRGRLGRLFPLRDDVVVRRQFHPRPERQEPAQLRLSTGGLSYASFAAFEIAFVIFAVVWHKRQTVLAR